MKVLLLGSNHASTAEAYRRFGYPPTILVDKVDGQWTWGHTSRQEFNCDKDLETVLSQAQEVYWTDPDMDEFESQEDYYNLLIWLKQYNEQYGNIANFGSIKIDPYGWLPQVPSKKHDAAVFFGCSFTAGVGLTNPNDRWANIVAAHFGVEPLNHAKCGGSNALAFDLISHMDFVPRQIVIWQISYPQRLRYCSEEKQLIDVRLSDPSVPNYRSMIDVFSQEFMFYELTIKIRSVTKMMRSMGVWFVFWLVDYKNPDVFSLQDQMCLYEYPEMIPSYRMQDYIVDTATDGVHPGIESNRYISRAVIDHLERLYT